MITKPEAAAAIDVHADVMRYVGALIRRTRNMPSLLLGASPRAGVDLQAAAKGLALVRGRSYVTPDEVKQMAAAVLRHRLPLQPEAEIEGRTVDSVLEDVFSQVDVPRMNDADA